MKQRAARSSLGLLCCFGSAIAVGATAQACGDTAAKQGPRNAIAVEPESDGGLFPLEDASGPPELDAAGLCGNQVHEVISSAPNIYFVLDASGSMASAASTRSTRYEKVRDAAVELVRNLGPRINVGAAVFPSGATEAEPCRRGDEVFPVTPGDPFTGDHADGETSAGFGAKTNVDPFGGTPTAATLERLTPNLAALPGKTIVLLATDGGPNCNASATCSADECMANIEGLCDADENCCAPGGRSGPEDCIDRADTVAAVAALAARGIDVYVIGIPGSETYSDVIDDMAVAGGVPQFVSPFYYKVNNLDTLSGVLARIASVVVSCEFDLVDPPPNEGETNVYLDAQVTPYDAEDGWRWKAPTVVELRGEACLRLKSGRVKQVQIVSGCPTEVAK